MFEYFNCGIDYLLIIDHTKSSVENILQQLTQIHTTSFLLGTFTSISKYFLNRFFNDFSAVDSTPPRNKTVRLPQQSRTRTIQLKNILFKYPKPSLTSTNTPIVVKDRMKQPIANDKTRCAVLISTNGNLNKSLNHFKFIFLDTSLLSLLAYSTSTIDCAFEIVLVLSTLASLSDIARVNELYPSVVTKVIQPKKYAARNYDLVNNIHIQLSND
jgi:hypothetical protein